MTPDPNAQGLKPDEVTRLLAGDFTQKDYAKYCKTPWFAQMKDECFAYFGTGCLGCNQKATTIQHPPRMYKQLFREIPERDVFPICQRCNRKLRRR